MNFLKKSLALLVIGLGMGTADIIPGVSGGTIAFIFGIYEELVYSIKVVTGRALGLFIQGRFTEAFRQVPWGFLLPLGAGILTAVFTLAEVLSYLMDAHPSAIWAFFFGLVAYSTFIVMRRVVTWDVQDKLAFAGSALVAFWVVGLVPRETPDSLLFVFVSGAIAICAMILPGISGSFLLVIMGKYEHILRAVTERDFLTLFVFVCGAVLGISLFSRFLSWLFRRHHDISIAILSGFMLGSLRKVWPFKSGLGANILPDSLSIETLGITALVAGGIVAMWLLARLHTTAERTRDIGRDDSFRYEHSRSLAEQEHE